MRADGGVANEFRPELGEGESHPVVAHHEAGHAWAAASKGRNVFEIDITHKDDFNPEAETRTDIESPDEADYAFLAYAGPWAEATFFVGGPPFPDIDTVWRYVCLNSYTDWPMIQKSLGRSDLRGADSLSAYMYGLGDDPRTPAEQLLPALTTRRDWHDQLEALWPNIGELAQDMLDGAAELHLTSNNVLVRITPTIWRRQDWQPPAAVIAGVASQPPLNEVFGH